MSAQITEKEIIRNLRNEINLMKETNRKLHDELRMCNQKLKESEAMKDHFVSHISNEIMNPFTSIVGLSQNIILSRKEDWKRIITMVAMIHSETFMLDFQLRNIFMVAKLEAGDVFPEISRVNIAKLIDSVGDSFRPLAKKRNLRINHNTELVDKNGVATLFPTDPEKLRLILTNLLSNALQYSYDKSDIDLFSKMDENELIIEVKDYGRGISKANQKVIYDRFKRLDSGINSLNRGHGLGLSVNKALLDILCGTIDLESDRDQGAKFTIRLPYLDLEPSKTALDEDELLFESSTDEEISF